MIDMHIHLVNSKLPGSKMDQSHLDRAPEDVASMLTQQMQESGIQQVLAMGTIALSADDPLGVNSTLQIARLVPGVHAVGVADPANTHPDHLRRVEEELKAGKVKALKGYSGYLYFGPDSPSYAPYYELAARYEVPFIFHTGDTYSTRAKVKYAHPLLVDEAAVDHPDVQFVMAHFGNPWLIDAAEVVYKNDNVWADLSGLLVGNTDYYEQMAQSGGLAEVARNVVSAMDYAERPDRFLYGSDWPLSPMPSYRRFIELMIPKEQQQAVFSDNARKLFRL